MTIADIARTVAIAVEGKKDGLYQKKGADWVIRFTIQAQELCDRLRDAPLGTRFQIALVQLNDDETPKEVMPNKLGPGLHKPLPRQAHSSGGATWHEMSAAQQTGILRNDPLFEKFLRRAYPDQQHNRVIDVIHNICGVLSCSEIQDHQTALSRWRNLVSEYRAWMREPEVV